jgi:guanine nucleotide-binding protein G(i) subunit alpha
VTALLFLVALSEFDLMLYEDESVNRMQEALALFDSICNSRWFVRTSIILFLNKIDLFREKLTRSPIANFFPDYHGGQDFQAGCDYFSQRFVSLNQSPAKQIYTRAFAWSFCSDVADDFPRTDFTCGTSSHLGLTSY